MRVQHGAAGVLPRSRGANCAGRHNSQQASKTTVYAIAWNVLYMYMSECLVSCDWPSMGLDLLCRRLPVVLTCKSAVS